MPTVPRSVPKSLVAVAALAMITGELILQTLSGQAVQAAARPVAVAAAPRSALSLPVAVDEGPDGDIGPGMAESLHAGTFAASPVRARDSRGRGGKRGGNNGKAQPKGAERERNTHGRLGEGRRVGRGEAGRRRALHRAARSPGPIRRLPPRRSCSRARQSSPRTKD